MMGLATISLVVIAFSVSWFTCTLLALALAIGAFTIQGKDTHKDIRYLILSAVIVTIAIAMLIDLGIMAIIVATTPVGQIIGAAMLAFAVVYFCIEIIDYAINKYNKHSKNKSIKSQAADTPVPVAVTKQPAAQQQRAAEEAELAAEATSSTDHVVSNALAKTEGTVKLTLATLAPLRRENLLQYTWTGMLKVALSSSRLDEKIRAGVPAAPTEVAKAAAAVLQRAAAVAEPVAAEQQRAAAAAAPVAAPASSEATLEASPAESTAIVAVGSFGGSPAPAVEDLVKETAEAEVPVLPRTEPVSDLVRAESGASGASEQQREEAEEERPVAAPEIVASGTPVPVAAEPLAAADLVNQAAKEATGASQRTALKVGVMLTTTAVFCSWAASNMS